MNQLNAIMEFDHVIEVDEDRNVTDAPDDIWAPEVYTDDVDQGGGWTLLNGYSSQFGYSGPEMHSSEYIGGRLAEAILETPGYYVATEICDPDSDASFGWVVAYLPKGES